MDLEGIMLSEISRTIKDKHCMISLICRILKIQQNSDFNQKRSRLPDTENKLVVTNGERQRKGQFRGVGIGSKHYVVCKIYHITRGI